MVRQKNSETTTRHTLGLQTSLCSVFHLLFFFFVPPHLYTCLPLTGGEGMGDGGTGGRGGCALPEAGFASFHHLVLIRRLGAHHSSELPENLTAYNKS